VKIVAFLDRSLYAQSVVDHAGWLAWNSGAAVELIQVVSPNELIAAAMPPIRPGGPVVLTNDRTLDEEIAQLRKQAATQLEQARERLSASGIADVAVRVLEGDVLQHMRDAAATAAIVVVGKRGEHADLARLPLGANFERLVRHTQTPVLAVSRQFRPIDRMLVGVALDRGAANAVKTLTADIFPRLPVSLLHVGEAGEAVRVELSRSAAILDAAGHFPATELAGGAARFVIPDHVVSDEIGLVALGAFGGSRLKSLIFGSLTSELVRACQVPVLLCQSRH
jgi:nucleotide-binding universal stress UspA family protein